MSQPADLGVLPVRVAQKVVPLHIPPSAATAEPGPSLDPAAVRAPPLQLAPVSASDRCLALVEPLSFGAGPAAVLQQMGFGEWQAMFVEHLKATLATGEAVEFYSCVLQSLKAHGIDPRQASAILAPLARQLTGAATSSAVPIQPPAGPAGVLTQLPPQPGPTIIPTDPLPSSAAPTAPGVELAPVPGGTIVGATEPKGSKVGWGLFALGVLGAGIAVWYWRKG